VPGRNYPKKNTSNPSDTDESHYSPQYSGTTSTSDSSTTSTSDSSTTSTSDSSTTSTSDSSTKSKLSSPTQFVQDIQSEEMPSIIDSDGGD
jgi:hypothetical protein